jgi:hypothetical protein
VPNQPGLINERIQEFLDTEKMCNKELLTQLTLYIFSLESKENNHDLYLLAKKIPIEYLIDLISYFDGDKIQLPTKEQFIRTYLIANALYLREILQLDWSDVKKILNLPQNELSTLSAISLGREINNIKDKFSKDINKIINNIDADEKEIKKMKKEIENEFNRK